MSEFNLSNYLVANKNTYGYVPRITCKDGFNMSVQCHRGAYCSPREERSHFYYKVEVGFPSEKPVIFADYAEDEEDYTGTVYPYVPIELVEQEIAFHGGIEQ